MIKFNGVLKSTVIKLVQHGKLRIGVSWISWSDRLWKESLKPY